MAKREDIKTILIIGAGCCCKLTLRQGIFYLAVIQITQNLSIVIYHLVMMSELSVTMPNVSTELVNIGLAAWCVHNLRFLHKDNTEPIYLFSFAKFLRFATCAIDILVAFFYYTLHGDPGMAIIFVLSNSFSTMYEFYYSYIAWSLVYHVVRGDHENDDNQGLPQDRHSPMVAFPVASKSDVQV